MGRLVNTGHGVEWRHAGGRGPLVNVSGGPLSYAYSLTHASLHFGDRDHQGSEHLLDNKAFPAEVGEEGRGEERGDIRKAVC